MFTHEEAGDEKAGKNEEHIDADETTARPEAGVVEQHRQDSHGSQTLDVVAMGRPRSRRDASGGWRRVDGSLLHNPIKAQETKMVVRFWDFLHQVLSSCTFMIDLLRFLGRPVHNRTRPEAPGLVWMSGHRAIE
ncbi:hypothetical protein Kisp02_32720 [Kineosporia sp. NBRC 101731]|nr:hypothetical protein Kisp02_32720 [Kineosporia sp. NBRC 101731]